MCDSNFFLNPKTRVLVHILLFLSWAIPFSIWFIPILNYPTVQFDGRTIFVGDNFIIVQNIPRIDKTCSLFIPDSFQLSHYYVNASASYFAIDNGLFARCRMEQEWPNWFLVFIIWFVSLLLPTFVSCVIGHLIFWRLDDRRRAREWRENHIMYSAPPIYDRSDDPSYEPPPLRSSSSISSFEVSEEKA